MTTGAARELPAGPVPAGGVRTGLRLARLHLVSRRVPAALAAMAACAVALRIALHWQWDAYGALQLPLVFETGCAAAIAVATASPFGEPERATVRWLPLLRLGTALALTAVAVGVLTAAGIGAHLAGGQVDALRNIAGLTGIGLLCAAVLGGALAWTAPTAYLVIAVYALYTQWHGPALTTPWLWPARPPHDTGAALCAGLVFVLGMAAIAVRGARDTAGE
ncbi:MAG TPA: hypothetical protein VGJ07_10800 [Rugosimonospora sp.]